MEAARRQGGGRAARRIVPLAGCVAAVLLLGIGMVSGGRLIERRQQPVAAGTAAQTGPRLQPAARAASAPATVVARSSARSVDAGNSEALPRGRFSGWERAAPRPPLGPSSLAALTPKEPAPVVPPTPDPGLPRQTLLFGPVATAAGRIEAAGHVIELDGIRIVDPARQCESQGGGSWPCGMASRAAFRAWLRGRAVECSVTPLPSPQPVVSLCRLGGKDMAAWLVANGLAEASPGGAYEQAGQEARAAHRGIFGDRPHPLALPAMEPALTTLDGALEPAPSEAAVVPETAAVAPRPFPPEAQ